MRTCVRLGLLVGVVWLALLAGAETDASPGVTSRVSVDSAGNQGNGESSEPATSADGRYVAFDSRASNLVLDDTNAGSDIFVHDRQTGATERVSVDSAGNQGNSESWQPAISANGRYVTFDSTASNLVAGDTNGKWDVFVHDRQTGVTERVSVDSAGNQGNGDSGRRWGATFQAPITADGRWVAFESDATNLVPGDTNGLWDVFVHDRRTGVTERVSVDSAGNQGNSYSEWPAMSADGRYVAFSSIASNLVPGDTNGPFDVFVHDRQTGVTERVSVDSAGNQGNNSSESPTMSADGRFVSFMSAASNLVAGDTNGEEDIFVHDRRTGATERVSVAPDGSQANWHTYFSTISADGRYAAFCSIASNLVADDTNGTWDVFVHDRQTGATNRVSVDTAGNQGNSASWQPAISANGRYVAFSSHAPNLVPDDSNQCGYVGPGSCPDVFVHDRGPSLCTISGVPLLKQTASPWRTDPYDNSSHTIGQWGCALTSAAMVVNYHGASVGFETNPRLLNNWLKAQGDGYYGANVNPFAVARYARQNGVSLYYHGRTGRDDATLHAFLCAGDPVVLQVPGHFIVATGEANIGGTDTWTINDPSFPRTDLRADPYANDYQGIREYSHSPASPALLIAGDTSVQLLVADPQGRRTGFDSRTGQTLQEIPGAAYTAEYLNDVENPGGEPSPTQYVVEILEPVDGTYLVELSTSETQPYTAYFYAYDEAQTPSTATASGVLAAGSTQTYLAHYSSEPGQPIEVEAPRPVGGIAELPRVAPVAARRSDSPGRSHTPVVGLAAAALVAAMAALAGGAWYARRRRGT